MAAILLAMLPEFYSIGAGGRRLGHIKRLGQICSTFKRLRLLWGYRGEYRGSFHGRWVASSFKL